MAEKFLAIERQFGINAYASSNEAHLGFAAVSKARYADFVVHEVGEDGKVARLTTLTYEDPDKNDEKESETKKTTAAENAPTAEPSSSEKKEDKKENGDNTIKDEEMKDATEEVSTTDEQKLQSAKEALTKLLGDDAASSAISMLSHWTIDNKDDQKDEDKNQPKSYTFPIISDKETRKQIHLLIRGEFLSPFALADTTEEKQVRIWHRKFERNMPNYGKFARTSNGGGNNSKRKRDDNDNRSNNKGGRGKQQWPDDKPNYLKFVLYKENIDTATACKDLNRLLNFNRNTNHRNKRFHDKNKKNSDVEYAGMKDKRGVTTQHVTIYRKNPNNVLFINKRNGGGGGGNSSRGQVSVLKVGNFEYTNEPLKLGRLTGNRFDIVLRNVDIDNVNDDDATNDEERVKAITERLTTAASTMSKYGFINYFGMQRFGKYHDTHKVGIAMLKGDFEGAASMIMEPKPEGVEFEKTYHARKRWMDRFVDVDTKNNDAKKKAEANCASKVKRDLGRFMMCEERLMEALSRRPCDYRGAFWAIPRNTKLMFLHAVQSYIWNKAASHRIEHNGSEHVVVGDLVLIEDKTSKEGGSGTSGLLGKKVAVVSDEDVSTKKYKITDVVIPMPGKLVQYPTNSTGEYINTVLKEEGMTKDIFTQENKELTLGGDYRKLICKPNDVEWEIKRYNDPFQPLIQTDLMKVTDEDLVKGEKGEEADGKLFGMVIGFTLPPSAYATVALRELMKRPTDREYQKMLMLEGRCERNLGKKDKEEENQDKVNSPEGGEEKETVQGGEEKETDKPVQAKQEENEDKVDNSEGAEKKETA